ncbi:protein PHYTOCHROME KINASE SUBSTRATE 3-like [Diospyros lotus]|uniref:protein PHYTOCHROME KINASE SUBSTRATE 3-like n=1 Tax=Diospyros lotus TaxID=55363 RepID=UPI00225AE774|nr:protein PHYTOCHROME KINASE SUBSTRATE 3-like [Diospyros lotus]
MDSQDISDLRVASFSAYLRSPEEKLVLKLTEENPRQPKADQDHQGHEIGVFNADKYFSMRMDHHAETDRKLVVVDPPQPVKPRWRIGTPSVSSESSWNSQSALLPAGHMIRSPSPSQIKQKKAAGRSCFTVFGFNGPCLSKKSVYVGDGDEEDAAMVNHKKDEPREELESFRFVHPIAFDGAKENIAGKRQLGEAGNVGDKPRFSIEVFGSNSMNKGDIAMKLERKLSMLTWDAIPKAPKSFIPSNGGPCDDIMSDASSDLFELETLSGTVQPYSTQYEPSEASIEWSVVTASAADFSAVYSDYDDKSIAGDLTCANAVEKMAKNKNPTHNEGPRSRPGGGSLLSCKNQKAVRVVQTAYKSTNNNDKSRPMSSAAAAPPLVDSWRKDFEFAPVAVLRCLSTNLPVEMG